VKTFSSYKEALIDGIDTTLGTVSKKEQMEESLWNTSGRMFNVRIWRWASF
jgi:hypothetical protein